MKRTLFNTTMMGCLAALSLAGCGDSGGGSSTVPSESLISEGFDWMEVTVGATSVCYGYKFRFYPEGNCGFRLTDDVNAEHIVNDAKWEAAYQGNGVFLISISGGNSLPADSSCEIRFAQPIELYISNMEKYRDGEVVKDPRFTSAPFTHVKHNGCPFPDGMYAIAKVADSIKQGKNDGMQ
ncbi:MAG: hypothetical protein MR894_07110 [Akkermansia muciniphila]|nr:hypothetical protein [Akkermansia muciniphila]